MMVLTTLQLALQDKNPVCELKFNEKMSAHTSFRIGGEAEVMCFPRSAEALAEILLICDELGEKFRILGAGTNVLAPDEGMPGVIICLKDCLDGISQYDPTHIRIMAGVTMTRAAVFAAKLGLSGLEFAHGIPGTVGGGIYMNAGAYGGEIKDVVESVTVMDCKGKVRILSADQMDFSYRHSLLEESGEIVICADFALTPSSPEAIRDRMKELQEKRSTSQPLNMPSAGSAFKRPVGGYAAALIDQSGLKGYTIGGAAVSTKHAGFVVNLGNATAADVRNLLQDVSDIVFEKSGIRLEPEVRIW